MADRTRIEWTDASWNPTTGCSHVSEGCRFCYAEAVSLRYKQSAKPWTFQNAPANVVLHPERLAQPLQWKRPRKIFVNSMSDLFHELIPSDFIDQVFGVMGIATNHTFQILTKRPERMLAYMRERAVSAYYFRRGPAVQPILWPAPNIWLGVSAEDQATWDERVQILGQISAAVRFVSAEPLLGDIDPGNAFDPAPDDSPYQPIDWVIVGGESGPNHRTMDVAWLQWLVQQCVLAGVPVFVKQDSGQWPGHQGRLSDAMWALKEFPYEAAAPAR